MRTIFKQSGRWKLKRRLALLLVGVCFLLPLALSSGQAFAAVQSPQQSHAGVLCSGVSCDHKSAFTTHCAGQSWDVTWPVTSAPVRDAHHKTIGMVTLWWSRTCLTNWAEIVVYRPSEFQRTLIGITLRVQWDNGIYDSISPIGSFDEITAQSYAPVALAAASGYIADGWHKGEPWYHACAYQDASLCTNS